MKKSKVIRKLTTLLKSWDNCKLDSKTSHEILDLLTSAEVGMLPPHSNQKDLGCECGCRGNCPKGNEWDYEHVPETSLQSNRNFYR